ncbi:MAG: amidohydrolase [Acidimicrobiales bacterium]|nr:MAG: amidohydrolase [Acidimicrobiales bacterium]
MVRIAGIQHDIVWEKPAENFANATPMIEAAVDDGAAMVVLSEMWSTGFSMNSVEIAERPDGPTSTFMKETAARTGAWIVGSFPEHTEGYDRPTNRLLMAGPAGEDHRYSKIHPFTYAREDEHYAAGRERLTVEVEGVRVTPLICYDLRFTDLFWNQAATTDCYIVPANWPAARQLHWSTLLRARAIENQAYVVGVNRVGSAGRLDYSGDSVIVDPLGAVIEAAPGEVTTIIGDIDPAVVAQVREDFPFMQDR